VAQQQEPSSRRLEARDHDTAGPDERWVVIADHRASRAIAADGASVEPHLDPPILRHARANRAGSTRCRLVRWDRLRDREGPRWSSRSPLWQHSAARWPANRRSSEQSAASHLPRAPCCRSILSTLISGARKLDPVLRSVDARSRARKHRRELRMHNPTPCGDGRCIRAMLEEHRDDRDILLCHRYADCALGAAERLPPL
jgi:hypothetical protein